MSTVNTCCDKSCFISSMILVELAFKRSFLPMSSSLKSGFFFDKSSFPLINSTESELDSSLELWPESFLDTVALLSVGRSLIPRIGLVLVSLLCTVKFALDGYSAIIFDFVPDLFCIEWACLIMELLILDVISRFEDIFS